MICCLVFLLPGVLVQAEFRKATLAPPVLTTPSTTLPPSTVLPLKYAKKFVSPYQPATTPNSFIIPYVRIRNHTTRLDTYYAPLEQIQTLLGPPVVRDAYDPTVDIDEHFLDCGGRITSLCESGQCNGDPVFCQYFSCDQEADHVCTILKSRVSFQYFGYKSHHPLTIDTNVDISSVATLGELEHKYHSFQNVSSITAGIMQMIAPDMLHYKLTPPPPLSDDPPAVYVDHTALNYDCPSADCHIAIKKRHFVHHLQLANKSGTIELPAVMQAWRAFKVVMTSGRHKQTFSVHLSPLNPCAEEHFSSWYSQWVTKMSCYQERLSTASWYIFTAVTLTTGALILTILSKLLFALRILISILVFLFRLTWFYLKRFLRYVIRKLPQLPNFHIPDNIPRPRRFRIPRMPPAMAIIGLLILFPVAFACSDALITQSTVEDCHDGGDMTSCSVSFDATITLPDLDHLTCINLVDPKDDPTQAVEVRINYTSLVCSVPTELLYFTRNYTAFIASRQSCVGAGTGCSSTNCLDTQPQDNPGAHFEKTIMDYPGTSSCMEVGGGWFRGCFLLGENSCLFMRRYLATTQKVYEVRKPTGTIHCQSFFTVTWTGQEEDPFQFEIEESGTAARQGLEISFIGRFDTPTIVLGNRALIKSANTQWWEVAAPQGSPKYGTVGDLQLPTKYYSTPINVHFDPLIFRSCNQADEQLICASGETGVQRLHKSKRVLPYNTAQFRVSADTDHLRFHMRASPAVTLRLKAPEFIKIRRKVQEVCPKGSVELVSGCYSCEMGVTVQLALYSTCHRGVVHLSLSPGPLQLTSRSLSISRNLESYDIFAHSNTKSLEQTLHIKAGAHKLNLKLRHTLHDPVISVADHLALGQTLRQTANPTGNWWSPFAFPVFSDLFDFLPILLGSLFLLLLLLVFLPFLLRLILSVTA